MMTELMDDGGCYFAWNVTRVDGALQRCLIDHDAVGESKLVIAALGAWGTDVKAEELFAGFESGLT